MHNLSLTDLTEQQRLTWYSTESDVKMCVVKGTPEENCQNYIRILVKSEPNNLYVCATNAFKPMCRNYTVHVGNYTLMEEKGGQAKCPYDPQHNSTFVYVDGELYTGTVADFAGMDPIIYREPLQTEQYDSMSLNGECEREGNEGRRGGRARKPIDRSSIFRRAGKEGERGNKNERV